MKTKETDTPLTERKVVRRGLLAGLAGLGATALLRVTGGSRAERAEAAPASLQYPAGPGDGPTLHTAYNATVIFAGATAASGPLFAVNAVDGPATVPHYAIQATAGGSLPLV